MKTINHFSKIILIFALVFGSTALTSAQFLRFGPKAGISSSKVQVDEKLSLDGKDIVYETGDAQLGFHVGAFARVSIVSFSIQPELLFTSAGGKIIVTEDGQTSDVRDLSYNKIDVPIMLGKSFGKIFRVQAGPSFSFLLSDDARDVSLQEELSQNYNNATVGYQVGVGFDLSKLSIDLKYEGNLSKFGESVSFRGESFDTDLRTSQFVLSVGFNLL
jgi:hypothetical protein